MGSLSCPRATGVSCPPGVRVASCSAMLRGCDKPRRKPPFSSVEARNRRGHPDDEPNQDHGRGRGRGPRACRHGRRGGPRADQHACARTAERLSTQLRSTQMLGGLGDRLGPLRAVELLERLCGLEGVLAVLGGFRSPRVPPWRLQSRSRSAHDSEDSRNPSASMACFSSWTTFSMGVPSRTSAPTPVLIRAALTSRSSSGRCAPSRHQTEGHPQVLIIALRWSRPPGSRAGDRCEWRHRHSSGPVPSAAAV